MSAQGVQVAIGGKPILHGGDLDLAAGRVVALLGPNGAGKSTLARAIAGLQPIDGGLITWDGTSVDRLGGRQLARLRAFVPQHAPVPQGMTVRDAVELGRAPHIGLLQRPTRADRDIVEEALRRVGAERFADRLLRTLSGGEVQRVRIAVALAQAAPCLMLDEPTASLDLGAAATVGQLLRSVAADGLAVLVVLHDLALAAAIADEVVVMQDGRSVAAGAPKVVLDRARLAETWHVDAALATVDGGTALTMNWLAPPPLAPAPLTPAARLARPAGADQSIPSQEDSR